MPAVAVVAAIFGAGANALSAVMQRRSTGQPDPKVLFSRKFMVATVKHKLWLAGVAFDILGFLLQALALYYGSLVVVEPLLTTDLIVLLLIIYFRYSSPIGRREWTGAVLICASLAALFIAGQPSDGRAQTTSSYWIVVAALVALVVVAAAVTMRRAKSERLRSAVGGFATGVNFALTAVFTKLMVSQLASGVLPVITSWPLYAMIISGISSVIVMQSTYGAGPLKISQPILTVVGPAVSVTIGITLLGSSLNHGVAALVAEVVSALALVAGLVMLSSSSSVTKFENVKI